MSKGRIDEVISGINNDLCSGLLYAHARINYNTSRALEALATVYGIQDLLIEKGVIAGEDLERKKRRMTEQVVKSFIESGISMIYQQPEHDKYTYADESRVDCRALHPVCGSVCCKLPHALSRQDVDEGIIRWEFGRPYLIAHDAEGFCVHLDRETLLCSVHAARPVACRGFDCSNTEKWRVWQDFEHKILNPAFHDEVSETVKKLYPAPGGKR